MTTETLYNPQQAYPVVKRLWSEAKNLLMAGHRLQLTLKPAKRSNDANARLHAMLTDVSRQVVWAGQKWDTEAWKRLTVASWMRTRNQSAQIVPALDGHGFDVIYQRTSELSGSEVSDLMSFIEAWGVEQGVNFTEPRQSA